MARGENKNTDTGNTTQTRPGAGMIQGMKEKLKEEAKKVLENSPVAAKLAVTAAAPNTAFNNGVDTNELILKIISGRDSEIQYATGDEQADTAEGRIAQVEATKNEAQKLVGALLLSGELEARSKLICVNCHKPLTQTHFTGDDGETHAVPACRGCQLVKTDNLDGVTLELRGDYTTREDLEQNDGVLYYKSKAAQDKLDAEREKASAKADEESVAYVQSGNHSDLNKLERGIIQLYAEKFGAENASALQNGSIGRIYTAALKENLITASQYGAAFTAYSHKWHYAGD